MSRRVLFIVFLALIASSLRGQESDYRHYLDKADSLIFVPNIKKSYENIKLAREVYDGRDQLVLDEIVFRDSLLKCFLFGVEDDAIVIQNAENIIKYFKDKNLPKQVMVSYITYFVEALIDDNKDPNYTLNIIDEALRLFNQIDKDEKRDSMYLAYLLHNRGNLKTNLSRYEEAKVDISEAINILVRRESKDSSLWGVMLYNLANAYYYDGDEVTAFGIVEQSERILSESSNPNLDYLSTIYSELSTYNARIGFHEKAEFYLNKSYRLFHQYSDKLMAIKGQSLEEIELHFAYLFLYNYASSESWTEDGSNIEKANDWLSKAESYFKQVDKSEDNRIVMGAVYNYMGEIYVNKSFYEDKITATKYYDKALKVLNDDENFERTLQYLFNKSKAYLYANEYENCVQTINEVILAGESINDSRLPYFYTMKAHGLLRSHDFDSAISYYEKVLIWWIKMRAKLI